MINARHVEFTGRKMKDKQYYWHTMHPGGLKTQTPKELAEKDKSEEVRTHVCFESRLLGGGIDGFTRPPVSTASVHAIQTHHNKTPHKNRSSGTQ